MQSGNIINIADSASARFKSVATLAPEGMPLTGIYTGRLLRVIPQHALYASDLSARLREAKDPEEVKRLTITLRDLPRYIVWEDVIHNLVTTVGRNLILDTILSGSGFTASVVMGLKGTGAAAAGDTQASHSGWQEVGGANDPVYSGNRKTPSFAAAASGSKSTSAAVSFTFTSSGTVAGAFININGSSTKDSTTGTLLSAGDFQQGSRSVVDTDVLDVTYTLQTT